MSISTRIIVGMADARVGKSPALITTGALGSCLGVTIWDPVVRVGGMLHVMLPSSQISPQQAEAKPNMFIDTGIPRLFRAVYEMGGVKERLIVKVAGGASSLSTVGGSDHFQIGKRNYVQLKKILWHNGVLIGSEDVGGTDSRSMSIMLDTGVVVIGLPREKKEL